MAKQKKLYEKEEGTIPIEAVPVETVVEEEVKKVKEIPLTEKEKLWKPKTELGKKVKSREIVDISQVLSKGIKIKEPEIVEMLIPALGTDFILIGQAHGKFGGGKRRIVRQTQKKTAEGNKPIFTVMAVVGNSNGYMGIGTGSAKETLPAKEKAVRNAKLNIREFVRGCGSWRCSCGEAHSLPFEVEGKCGSVTVKLMPAPKGRGLVADNELKKILSLAGYKDIWSKTFGQTRQKMNFVSACMDALEKASKMKLKKEQKPLVKYGSS